MSKPSVVIDDAKHEVRVNGREIHLPPKQYTILQAFLQSNGRLLTRTDLMAACKAKNTSDSRCIDQYIARIRRYGVKIKTLTGYGYRYVQE